MKNTLQAGVTGNVTFEVDRERTIDFMGEKARVYATPMLVRDIEIACRELLLQHLDPGEDSVGTRVELDHSGATLMGMQVDLAITIAEVKGRAVTLRRHRPRQRRADLPRPPPALRRRREEDRGAARGQGAEGGADMTTSATGHAPRADLLLPVRRRARPADRQGGRRRGHRGRAEFLRRRHAPGRRQGLRQGLRAGAEDLQPEPRADADEAHATRTRGATRTRASCRSRGTRRSS